MEIFFKHR